ncbi:MAG: terminase, partial [bacterium]
MPASTSKYKPEYDDQAFKLCLLGSTDAELANFFDVQESTINLWKKDQPTFMESLKAGKQVADYEVVKSLYKRARGYKYEETTSEDGVVTKLVKKEMPP